MDNNLPKPPHQVVAAPRTTACRLVSWTPWSFPNNALIGRCAIAFAGGLVVHRVPVFKRADGSLSVGTPDAPEIDGDGRVRLTADGKKQYAKVITFETTEGRERWQRMVLAALAAGGITGAPESAP
jgi:hypothetical protein